MYQRFTGLGRTTSDLELRFLSDGVAVANFDFAINRGNNKRADYLPCVVWNDKAKEYTDKIGKGSLILIEGQWRSYSYKTEEGKTSSYVQLEVTFCKFVDLKPVGQKEQEKSE